MKALEKFETMLDRHRERVTVALIVLFIALYMLGCKASDEETELTEVPAYEMQTSATEAQYVPDWAPAGTDRQIRYYYLPSVEAYYDTYVGQYVYYNGVTWVYGATLPRAYARIDFHVAPVIFLSIGINQPWLHHSHYVVLYHKYKGPGWARHAPHGRWHCFDENTGRFYGPKHIYAGGPKPGNTFKPRGVDYKGRYDKGGSPSMKKPSYNGKPNYNTGPSGRNVYRPGVDKANGSGYHRTSPSGSGKNSRIKSPANSGNAHGGDGKGKGGKH